MVALTTQQRLVILHLFFISLFFIMSLQTLMRKIYIVWNLYCISYTLSFCYVMCYIAPVIYIGEHFLEECFYCYFQQFISVVASESPIPYNLIKRAPKTQNLYHCNTECLPKLNQKHVKYSSVFRTKYFVPHKYKQ